MDVGRLKDILVHRVLKLDDTPHKIALGVFLGFFVAATPTIGLQMIGYLIAAAALGANKISGILPVWLSNPVTAVPLYYGNWKLGSLLMGGAPQDSSASRSALKRLFASPEEGGSWFERIADSKWWSQAFDGLSTMGLELWLGSLLVGLVLGLAGYGLTYWAVIKFRSRSAVVS